MGIGFTVQLQNSAFSEEGCINVEDARMLPRAWLCGYDVRKRRTGAIFVTDGEEREIFESGVLSSAPEDEIWRPATDVSIGTRLGVLWSEQLDEAGSPQLVIFQDGVERLRLNPTGRLPRKDEELYALV